MTKHCMFVKISVKIDKISSHFDFVERNRETAIAKETHSNRAGVITFKKL